MVDQIWACLLRQHSEFDSRHLSLKKKMGDILVSKGVAITHSIPPNMSKELSKNGCWLTDTYAWKFLSRYLYQTANRQCVSFRLFLFKLAQIFQIGVTSGRLSKRRTSLRADLYYFKKQSCSALTNFLFFSPMIRYKQSLSLRLFSARKKWLRLTSSFMPEHHSRKRVKRASFNDICC
jgi:hypothetical protein